MIVKEIKGQNPKQKKKQKQTKKKKQKIIELTAIQENLKMDSR